MASAGVATFLPKFPSPVSKFRSSGNNRRRRSTLSPRNSATGVGEASSSSVSSNGYPSTSKQPFPGKPEADVVVIGSGIAGLCCAGLLARYQQDVLVLESHDVPGGAAHSFDIKGYKFDSGPSLFSGFQSRGPQANPLAQVLDALGESIPCTKYDSWMVYIPEGEFLSRIGPTEFFKDLENYAGPDSVREWKKLLDAILPMSAAAMALPPLSIRGDLGILSTAAARYAPSLLKSFAQMGPQGALGATKLLRPFSEIIDSLGLKDPFIRNWLDLLAFLLAGVKTNGILSAEMVYMFSEWYKPGCTLEYPLHGSGAIVDALVRGLQKFGGRISLKSHVESIVVENCRATGVKLRSGQFVRAKKAVVSNASMWDTLNLLPKDVVPKTYQDRIKNTPQCESFMHLHLGFDAEGIRDDLGIHHIVVNDWERGVDADQNVVLISVPSVLSPNLAPPGKHILHAYTPGTEPFEIWEGLDRKSSEYKNLKAERSEVMWKAVERALGPGFSRDKCEVKLVGTPLTHQRFLRRNRGTYGPAILAGKDTFPGHSTPIPQLLCCGDSTFPGIGVPAVAASGAIVANSLVSVSQHSQLLDAVGI
nr:prolycopene isomerase, chloroplastic [Ipomoea batatas]